MLQVQLHPALRLPRLVHAELCCWLIVLALLDVVMTSMVLRVGGSELNPLARLVIEHAGIAGMIMLKGMGTLAVLVIAEYVGRQRFRTGRRVLLLAVTLNAAAVGMGGMFVGAYTLAVLTAI